MSTTILQTTLSLPVTPLRSPSPLPQFSAMENKPFQDGGLLQEEKPGFNQHTGRRVLPYAMQDRYAATLSTQPVQAILLENNRMRATFLPQYGGRLYSLWDKKAGRECLYVNNSIILRNLALRNAWFSGGVEWNFGHFGHTYFTCQDVFFEACQDDQGQPFLRMYEYERCKQLTFQVDFHLPEGAGALTAHLCIYNTQSSPVPIFYWTNIALPEEKGLQVYSGTDQVIGMSQSARPEDSFFYHSTVPTLTPNEQQAADPTTLQRATEYFFQNPPTLDASFEAVQYPDGRLFAERSTSNCPYRKMFCWGVHQGGKHWQQFLAGEGSGDYFEAQAGISRTQEHMYSIEPHTTIHITQQFTMGDVPLPTGDYLAARAAIQRQVEQLLPTGDLEAMHTYCQGLSGKPSQGLLHAGTGWGALERMRDDGFLPAHLPFAGSPPSQEQAPWLALLRGESFPEAASFMVSPLWLAKMEAAEQKTFALWTQLGIAYLENGQHDKAKQALEASLQAMPTPLALRTLAQLSLRQGAAPAEALRWMEQAMELLQDEAQLPAYAVEYLQLLSDGGAYPLACAYYQSLPAVLRQDELVLLALARSAYEERQEELLKTIFTMPLSTIREGEDSLLELWFLYTARKAAEEKGEALTPQWLERIKKTAAPPPHLDFRMAD